MVHRCSSILIVCCLLALAMVAPASVSTGKPVLTLPDRTPPDQPSGGTEGLGGVKWLPDWNAAQRMAARDNRPMLIYFQSPLCGWCQRMEQETLSLPEIRKSLSGFVLVSVNILEDEKTPARFRVRGTPCLIFASPEGRETLRLDGFVTKQALLEALSQLQASRLQNQDERIQELIKKLQAPSVPQINWEETLLAFSNDRYRSQLLNAISGMRPLPRTNLVQMLDHRLLAVRLGALEALEELTGDDYGFNPWSGPLAENKESAAKWSQWSRSTNAPGEQPVLARRVFTPDEAANYLQDLLSDDPDRSARARRMLEKGGSVALEAIRNLEAANPGMPSGSRNRLKELRYALSIPAVHGMDPVSLAHRLVFGNLDVRLKALRDCAAGRQRVVPIIKEFLTDPEPLVRETAVDALATAGGRAAVAVYDEHLKKEGDANVIYGILRQLGNLRSKKGLSILVRYLDNPNEDLVIIALESLGKLQSDSASDAVARTLKDKRWRVRVAALNAAKNLGLEDLRDQVTLLLKDNDEFVQNAAVETLARLGTKQAVSELEILFGKNETLRAPIIKALNAADASVTDGMIKALENSPPASLRSVLELVTEYDWRNATDKENTPAWMQFLCRAARHSDADVACTALRYIARFGMQQADYQKAVAEVAQTGEPRRLQAIMSSLQVDSKTLARYNPQIRKVDLEQSAVVPAQAAQPRKPAAAEDVFAAFENRPAAQAAASNAGGGKKKTGLASDIFGAFESTPTTSENFFVVLSRCGKEALNPKNSAELQWAAATMLVQLGDASGVPVLLKALPGTSVEQRSMLVLSTDRIRNKEGRPLIEQLLQDPSLEVRQAAVRNLMEEGGNASCLQLILDQVKRPKSVLNSADIFEILESAASKPTTRPLVTQTALSWMTNSSRAADQTVGLVLLGQSRSPELEKAALNFITSSNQWHRRAAYHALSQASPEKFVSLAAQAAVDSSDMVREVVPQHWMGRNFGLSWVNYFDGEKQSESYSYRSYDVISGRSVPEMDESVRKVLTGLTSDRSERIRIKAMFALIVQEQPVDLAVFARMLDGLPRDSELLRQFSSYFLNNYAAMGKEFAVLVPSVDIKSDYDKTRQEKVLEHFGIKEAEELADVVVVTQTNKPVIASYVPVTARPVVQVNPENFKIVYFSKPGCKDCEAVSRKLEQIRETFTNLVVVEYDINKTASVLLNEALCKRFSVPPAVRLVAPSIFSGGGYLVKDEITLERMGQMLVQAASVPLTNWMVVQGGEITLARQDIEKRYQKTGLGLVITAGLLDGINPCAFATMIFLLSYLQVTRKTGRQIVQIGLSYVLGVFLAYYAVGLGLTKVLSLVTQLRWAGMVMNFVMAAFALFIMALSIRDGVRAMRGQLSEMTLQLPDVLKNQIHRVVRTGVRHAHFVLAAFFVGVAISFLELACTGQVYLPTITFMIQQGEKRAMLDLLAYNLAFILPLAIVFVLSCQGLRSEHLSRLLKKRAAWVKFATAALFLFLALFLIWGTHLLG